MGVLAALHEREQTGEGQVVDTSLFEAGITHTFWQSAIAFATGVAPLAMGSRHPLNAPYQAFRTADSWMCVGAASPRNWQRLMDLLEAQEIAEDPLFADNVGRMANTDALDEKLSEIFVTATTEEWLKRFEDVGIPAGPINNVMEMHADPQTAARNMTLEVEHPTAGNGKNAGPTGEILANPPPTCGRRRRSMVSTLGRFWPSTDFPRQRLVGSSTRTLSS